MTHEQNHSSEEFLREDELPNVVFDDSTPMELMKAKMEPPNGSSEEREEDADENDEDKTVLEDEEDNNDNDEDKTVLEDEIDLVRKPRLAEADVIRQKLAEALKILTAIRMFRLSHDKRKQLEDEVQRWEERIADGAAPGIFHLQISIAKHLLRYEALEPERDKPLILADAATSARDMQEDASAESLAQLFPACLVKFHGEGMIVDAQDA